MNSLEIHVLLLLLIPARAWAADDSSAQPLPAKTPPNILLILSDDQSVPHLG